ncbi:MAG: outer membrane beta-barrel protein [Gemmatimonadetes bacterium]|nr:outer membrane beta-barrel protein [Gemmatimonadota bacterium]MDA1102649.1 outer membrane beta-barrel protein [Gemmatimonadota bacterium]
MIDLSYIELPLHFRLPLVGAGPIRLNLVLGPTIGINTGCDIKVDQAAAQACADFVDGFDVKKLDWSGAAGLGLSFRFGSLAYAGADLKYALGFTSVSETSDDLKNRAFSLQSHLGFDIF